MSAQIQFIISPSGERLVVLPEATYHTLLKGILPTLIDPEEGELTEEVTKDILRAAFDSEKTAASVAYPEAGKPLRLVKNNVE